MKEEVTNTTLLLFYLNAFLLKIHIIRHPGDTDRKGGRPSPSQTIGFFAFLLLSELQENKKEFYNIKSGCDRPSTLRCFVTDGMRKHVAWICKPAPLIAYSSRQVCRNTMLFV